MALWARSIPGRGNSQGKGLGQGACLAQSGNGRLGLVWLEEREAGGGGSR